MLEVACFVRVGVAWNDGLLCLGAGNGKCWVWGGWSGRIIGVCDASEDFKIAASVVETYGKAGEEAVIPQEAHADVLHALAKPGI